MNIEILSISNPVPLAGNPDLRLTQFDVTFRCEHCAGEGKLRIVHGNFNVGIADIEKCVYHRHIDVGLGVADIYDFEDVGQEGKDSILSLGTSAGYHFCGRLANHLTSGEGSEIGIFDTLIAISVDDVPPDSLEVVPGNYVSFKAKRLIFMLT